MTIATSKIEIAGRLDGYNNLLSTVYVALRVDPPTKPYPTQVVEIFLEPGEAKRLLAEARDARGAVLPKRVRITVEVLP
jgi:hypothetical protein